MIDLEAIDRAVLVREPFCYAEVDHLLTGEQAGALRATFPHHQASRSTRASGSDKTYKVVNNILYSFEEPVAQGAAGKRAVVAVGQIGFDEALQHRERGVVREADGERGLCVCAGTQCLQHRGRVVERIEPLFEHDQVERAVPRAQRIQRLEGVPLACRVGAQVRVAQLGVAVAPRQHARRRG